MKNKLLLIFVWITTLHGEMRETAHIGIILDEIQNCLPEEALVVCDIDNTLLKASQSRRGHGSTWVGDSLSKGNIAALSR